MTTSRNPLAFDRPITLDNLPDLFAHHRGLTGGWSMDANDGGSGGEGGSEGDGGSGGGSGGGQGGTGNEAGSGGGRQNATDGQGNDLGFPKDTPIAEMTDKEQVAYWRNISRKHEGRFKDLVGDRDAAEVKKDLDEIATIRRDQQTPAEQALTEAREKGKAEGIQSERNKAATAIFRGALEAAGIEDSDELDEIASSFNVSAYVSDSGIDTTKITNFAKKFGKSDRDTSDQGRRRDYGGGDRGGSGGRSSGGSVAQVMAERRAAREGKSAKN